MALGGGTFIAQNKILPGSYINFISAARASANMSERGIVAMPYVGDWGPEDTVVEISAADLQKNSLKLFGYDYTAPDLAMFREIFRNATTMYSYRLNSGTVKAANTYATARYGGTRGNDITIVIRANVDEAGSFDVITLMGGSQVDEQTVKTAGELADNDFVAFKKDAELALEAGIPLAGGSNGEGRTGANYQKFLDKIEAYSFHALGCNTDEKAIIDLFIAFTKRMRDEMGVKFQTVVYRADKADHEGIISVENKLLDVDYNQYGDFSLVYWVTGAAAGCGVNQSNLNKVYDGEYKVDTDYTQKELEDGIKAGKFMLHNVGDTVRVLEDINTFVSVTDEKSADFSSNQTIRVLDQIGNDIAAVFNDKYLGKVPNDNAGRISLWNDIVKHHQQLETIRAIENFEADDVVVEAGETKKSVVVTDYVTPVNAMGQLYMTVIVE